MPRRKHDRRSEIDLSGDSYWHRSRQPLQILVFLLPFILAYEIALALVLRRGDDVLTNLAHKGLLEFFDIFGISQTGGLVLGGVLIVAVLLAWHILSHAQWRVSMPAVGLMAIESLFLALPLLLMGQVIVALLEDVSRSPLAAVAMSSIATNGPSLQQLDLTAKIAISIGAGLYEELIFRMLLIAIAHTMLVNVIKLSDWLGTTIAIVLSAVAFAMYHPLRDMSGEFSNHKAIFFFVAGLYFGLIFAARGFGIVVAVHAIYNVITISLIGADSAA